MQKFRRKIFDRKCPDVLYACFSFKLSHRLNIDKELPKLVQMIVTMYRVQG